MKNKELFEKTVNILVKAFQDETLNYADCKCCAVGNIVAANNNIILVNKDDHIYCQNGHSGIWGDAFRSFAGGPDGLFKLDTISLECINQIKSTGYSLIEVAIIEQAFSEGTGADIFKSKNEENFSGLMKVIDSLMEIHEANIEETNIAKSLFIKETA